MRYDTEFDYTYLIKKIESKYKQNTILKNINLFCKDLYYITPFKVRLVILNNRGYFNNRDIYKMSKALELSDADIIKCFYKVKEVNDGYSN